MPFSRTSIVAALAGAAAADMIGISAPKTIVANMTFPLGIITNDVAGPPDVMALGVYLCDDPRDMEGSECVDLSYQAGYETGDFTKDDVTPIRIPIGHGTAFLVTELTSLDGPHQKPREDEWSVPITFGDRISPELNYDMGLDQALTTSFMSTSAPSATATTHRSRSAGCFPPNIQSDISDVELQSIQFQYGLAQSNDQAGKQAHGEMKRFLGAISMATGAGRMGENCDNPAPSAWPNLSAEDSKDRALELLQVANKEMELLRDPVAKCDLKAAKQKTCDARAVVNEIDLYPGYL